MSPPRRTPVIGRFVRRDWAEQDPRTRPLVLSSQQGALEPDARRCCWLASIRSREEVGKGDGRAQPEKGYTLSQSV